MAVFLVQQPRSVFIHIPKTGGTSIRLGFFGGKVEGPKQGFVPEAWQSLFKFAFVRNPYDRIISAWRMFNSGMQKSVWEHPQDESGIDFKRFLEIVIDKSIPFDGAVRRSTAEKIRHHTVPQTHPFHCLEQADFVGRFENLKSDFSEVCKHLGIQTGELPHWNRTQREENCMRYFNEETLGIVNDFYANDFQSLDYEVVHALEFRNDER